MFSKIKKILFLTFLFLAIVSYFQKENYRKVNSIDEKILSLPTQREAKNKNPIIFNKDGYRYTLAPLFDYDLKALIVHENSYDTWYSIYSLDTVFPKDLCVMWGDNIKNKIYKSKDISFSQDFRFCLYHYHSSLPVSPSMISNNHLLTDKPGVEKIIKTLKAGDQVEVIGKLVNVSAKQTGKGGRYDPESFAMNSSTSRTDDGAGACEIIYVEDIKVLKKYFDIYGWIYKISLSGMLAIIIWNFFTFLVYLIKGPQLFKN